MLGAGLTAAGAALVALSAVHMLFPQRNGILALSQVFAPHLYLLVLAAAAPLALRQGTPSTARVAIGIAALIGLARFGPGMASLPAASTDGAQQLPVLSWNLASGEAAGHVLVERLLGSEAQIVGLQEFQPEHVAAIAAEPSLTERFPYHILEPRSSDLGMALLSAYPIMEWKYTDSPPLIVARVDLGDGRALSALNAHPLPARIRFVGPFPVGYDASRRDGWLSDIRGEMERRGGDSLVLLGDFNVTDREPGFADLTAAGLIDAHAAVGNGTGSTWRPPSLDFLPFGLLRIDYVFTDSGARPLSVKVECLANAGDHCIVSAVVEVP